MAKKTKKKSWYTVAWLTREGVPHANHHFANFSQVYKSRDVLVEDLVYGMTHFSRSAYVVMAWPGQVTAQAALRSSLKPILQVFEDGHVQEIS